MGSLSYAFLLQLALCIGVCIPRGCKDQLSLCTDACSQHLPSLPAWSVGLDALWLTVSSFAHRVRVCVCNGSDLLNSLSPEQRDRYELVTRSRIIPNDMKKVCAMPMILTGKNQWPCRAVLQFIKGCGLLATPAGVWQAGTR